MRVFATPVQITSPVLTADIIHTTHVKKKKEENQMRKCGSPAPRVVDVNEFIMTAC